ncbi:MAG: cadherin-like beta sandwich domain-containing protein [Myxococcaceae bacterium]|nr:cadherin-like beta sandwich domain-containing protein [Myxococcaceae bacterium]
MAAGGCAGTLTTCAGRCVDPQSDVDNCGQCGRGCGSGQACNRGTCQVLPSDCTTVASCPPGFGCDVVSRQCTPGCRRSADCPMGGTCSGNQCQCPTGQHACGQRCVSDVDVVSCGTSCQACPMSPPAPVCLNGQTLRTSGVAACTAGACGFMVADTTCPFGCNAGACRPPDPCLGVSCTTPPANTCADAMTRRTFPATGMCSGGTCSYAPVDTSCASQEVCQAGTCRWNDASLSSLTVAPGSLGFSPSQTMYAVSVPPGTSSVVVTAAVAQPTRATVRVNGTVTSSGAPVTVALTGGVASVPVRVDAESGVFRTYTVVVVAASTTIQQAYVKASNTGAGDEFSSSVALSADGSTLAVGAPGEDSSATGVNGNQAGSSAGESGAVYVFTRTGSTWAQQAYVKASNTGAGDEFGSSVALSVDGSTLAVGASREDSSATGVNGNQAGSIAAFAGAVYVFTRTGSTWAQQAYVKASNTGADDRFGSSVALSVDGSTLAVGARSEASNATGVNGTQTDNSAFPAGAVYVFTR